MTQLFRPTILRFETLTSTNTEAARQAASGAPEGLCIVAGEQTAGRGRQQRHWVSPPGAGLYFSAVLRPRHLEMRQWPLLTLMSALAVCDALAEECRLNTDIKWPNDVFANGRKLCGILAETVETPAGRAVIIGIGINLRAGAYPPELLETSVSVEDLTGQSPDAEALLRALTSALADRYRMLQAEAGARLILREWAEHSSYAQNMPVRVSLVDEEFRGVTRGLASDGALRVETDEGEIRIVRAGDVSALRRV